MLLIVVNLVSENSPLYIPSYLMCLWSTERPAKASAYSPARDTTKPEQLQAAVLRLNQRKYMSDSSMSQPDEMASSYGQAGQRNPSHNQGSKWRQPCCFMQKRHWLDVSCRRAKSIRWRPLLISIHWFIHTSESCPDTSTAWPAFSLFRHCFNKPK